MSGLAGATTVHDQLKLPSPTQQPERGRREWKEIGGVGGGWVLGKGMRCDRSKLKLKIRSKSPEL